MSLRFHEIAEARNRILNRFTHQQFMLHGEICSLPADDTAARSVLRHVGGVLRHPWHWRRNQPGVREGRTRVARHMMGIFGTVATAIGIWWYNGLGTERC
jgi:hypothetical protein